jgi:photosystem II stability/assembly factor-like uncharacterized protein
MRKILLVIPLVLLFAHLMMASDGPNVWSVTTTGVGRVINLAISPANQYVMYCGSLDSGIMKSTNGGLTWFGSRTGMTHFHVQALSIAPSNPNIIYAGTDSLGGANSGVYKSTDAGATWTLTSNTAIEQKSIQMVTVSPTDPNVAYIAVFNAAANSTHGIYKTTNGGTSWAPASTGLGNNKNMLCVTQNPLNANVLYCGTSLEYVGTLTQGPPHIYKTNNAAASWTEVSNGLPTATTENNPVRDMTISRSDTAVLLAVMFNNTTNGGAYITTNGGTLWNRRVTGLITVAGNLPRGCLIRSGSSQEMYIGVDNATAGGVYRTTNQGNLWVNFNSGPILPTYATRTFAMRTTLDSTLFTGVGSTSVISPPGMGIYEYTFNPLVGVTGNNGNIPKEFALHQNFPNPFNPTTNIQYDIPRASIVNITVFDAAGRVVKELVNDHRNIGKYNVVFDASSVSSGIYFCKITAGDFTATKKMILVK